jgi:predicted nucleic acid-binding protein
MTGGFFLDTNILVYAALQPDPRSNAARALLARRGVVSIQVLNEFANVAHRKLHRPWPEIARALDAMRTLCHPPLAITLTTHEAALTIAEQTGYQFYDALIVASALEAGCDTLYSEDLQHGRVIDGRLTIRNPFAPEAHP